MAWNTPEQQARKRSRDKARYRYRLKPCEVCGAVATVHRHHKDGNALNNALDNIAFLCVEHHQQAHTLDQPF